MGPSLNTKSKFRIKIVNLAEEIIDEYLKSFGYDRHQIPKVWIYIYDFKDELLGLLMVIPSHKSKR